MSFSFLLSIAVLAGMVGALSGVGGGVILVPTLSLLGIDIKQAIAISNLSTVAVSNGAAPGYLRRHMPNLKAVTFLEPFAVLGAVAGALMVLAAPRPILFLVFGLMLLFFGFALWRRIQTKVEPILEQDAYSRWIDVEGSYYDDAEGRTVSYRGHRALLAGFLMGGAGMTTGLLGIGGSALAVLIHQEVLGFPPKVSLTTSNLIIGVMALAGANIYLEGGLINPKLVAPVILGVLMGAFIGSRLLVHLQNRVVRGIFLVVLMVFGLEMLAHGLRGGP